MRAAFRPCMMLSYVAVGVLFLTVAHRGYGQQQEAIDQAIAASEYSGAPMLVIAGRESCPNCQRLLEQLGQRELSGLTSGMVPLKIDVDEPEWREFAGRFGRPEGATLPFVYVIRADGETLHSHSGPMESVQFANVIGAQLPNVGRRLTERQLQSIRDAVEESRHALEADRPAEAVRELLPLKRIGDLGQLGSYAKSAIEADQLVRDLVQQVSEQIGDVPQRLQMDDQGLGVCFDLVHVNRIYGTIPAVESEWKPVLSELRRNRDMREVMQIASAIDRACKLCENRSTLDRGLESLRSIVAEYEGLPAAEVAQQEIDRFEIE